MEGDVRASPFGGVSYLESTLRRYFPQRIERTPIEFESILVPPDPELVIPEADFREWKMERGGGAGGVEEWSGGRNEGGEGRTRESVSAALRMGCLVVVMVQPARVRLRWPEVDIMAEVERGRRNGFRRSVPYRHVVDSNCADGARGYDCASLR